MPLLYTNISFNWGTATRKWVHWKKREAYVQSYTDQPPIPLLLRTLISSLRLSSYVKSAEFGGVKPYPDWKKFDHYHTLGLFMTPSGKSRSIWSQYNHKFSHKETWGAMKFIHTLPFTDRERKTWLSEYDRGDMDLFICLVILKSSNLKFLRVVWDFCRTEFIATIFGSAFKSFHKGLRTADFCSDLSWPEDVTLRNKQKTFESFYNLYSFPDLTSLTVSPGSTRLQLPAGFAPSNLTSLLLSRTSLNEDDLHSLLQFTPHLSELVFDFWIEVSAQNDENQVWFDCAKFSRALKNVRNSLRKLVLSVIFFDHYMSDYDMSGFKLVNPPVQDLYLLPKLEILEIPWTLLLGWSHESNRVKHLKDALPPCLQTLILRDDIWYDCFNNKHVLGGQWTEEDLLGMIQDYLPKPASGSRFLMQISNITIRLCQWDDIWAEPWRIRLVEICGEAGVVGYVEILETLYEAFKTEHGPEYGGAY